MRPDCVPSKLWQSGVAAVSVGLAEVYLDQVRDLGRMVSAAASGRDVGEVAAPKSARDEEHGGLSYATVTTAEEAHALVASAVDARVTADNGLNATSSRSHLVVFYALLNSKGERKGQLALVDLAGSERLHRTEATGERREEARAVRLASARTAAIHFARTAPLPRILELNWTLVERNLSP